MKFPCEGRLRRTDAPSRTTRGRRRAAAVALAALVLLPGCGGDPEARPDGSEVTGQDDLDSLEDRVVELEGLVDDLGASDDRFATRLRRTTQRLQGSVSALRSSLRTAEEDARGALDDAGASLSQIGQVARDLSVLTERYDYHLKRYHGGSE